MFRPSPSNDETPFQALCHKIWVDISKKFVFKTDSSLRFAPRGTAATVLSERTLRELFSHAILYDGDSGQVEEAVGLVGSQKLHDVIAVMICANVKEKGFRNFIGYILALPHDDRQRDLGSLPWSESKANGVFQDAQSASGFLDYQMTFCAVTLRKNTELRCPPGTRLPFLPGTQKLGEGAYGQVFRVCIAEGHVSGASLDGEKVFARKDYRINREDMREKERQVISAIVTNTSTNRNILEIFCSVEIDDTYSLFMELAECDLKKFLERAGPSGFHEKANILYQAVGLASGLHHLHTGLRTEAFEQLSCFHLDIKPDNILVVKDETDGKIRWKLSDFNMSKVRAKTKDHHTEEPLQEGEHPSTDFNRSFIPRHPYGTASATVLPRDGTYLSPEACQCIPKRQRVRTESDTWSLGCVLSVVLSYIVGGAAYVAKFREERSRNRDNDQFFSLKAARWSSRVFPGRSRESGVKEADRVNPNVEAWFVALARETSNRPTYGDREREILKRIMDMLLRKVLIVDPDARSRTKVDFIAEELGRAANAYNALENKRTDMAASSQPTNRLIRQRSNLDTVDFWHVPNGNQLEQCHVSPDGRSVLFRDADYIKIYSLDSLCEPGIPDSFPLLGCRAIGELPGSVKQLVFSNTYVAVLIEQFPSQLYIYSYHNSEASAGFERIACISIPSNRVHEMALSPDGCYIACVCTSGGKGSTDGHIYVNKLPELLYDDAELSIERGSIGKLSTVVLREKFWSSDRLIQIQEVRLQGQRIRVIHGR
ncbi:MAG: hypothetical protein M1822_004237 [Bathelium mastoideum]|nr:MAG: hypothetical protein M1822_004237 [Bathelium mastoideum]